MTRGRDRWRPATTNSDDPPPVPSGVDPTVPSPARLYDYYLGGRINFPADQEAAERIRGDLPEISDMAWANRGFHQRAAKWLAADRGISQFVDIGSGLPTQGNTHQVVREVAPHARVVYVDYDPLVRAYAGELLADRRLTTFVFADLREPGRVLGSRQLQSLIDFTEPVGLIMTGVMHFVADGSDPWELVRSYLRPLAAGSYLALSHATADGMPPQAVQRWEDMYTDAPVQLHLRDRASVRQFFSGLRLEPPYEDAPADVTYLGLWGCEDPGMADSDGSRWGYCGVARRP